MVFSESKEISHPCNLFFARFIVNRKYYLFVFPVGATDLGSPSVRNAVSACHLTR